MSATTSTLPAAEAPVIDKPAMNLTPAVLELLASKICHDLISPVGAINNGLELLEEMGMEAGGDAMQLVTNSAAQAGAKLQMFRVVYGAGGRDGHIKPEDIQKMFAAVVDADGRVKQAWDPRALKLDELAPGFCKLLMGCLMLAQDCLPKGGVVAATQTEPREVTITAAGVDAAPRARFEEALALKLPVAELDPRLIHPHVMGLLVAEYGYVLRIAAPEAGITKITLAVG